MVFVLALFPFCSSDERNTTQHHDIPGHIRNRSQAPPRLFRCAHVSFETTPV
jgi:hypothetical protein